MASAQPSLDTVITVKVNYDGTTRRAKMPLRDTAPKVLEEQVRSFALRPIHLVPTVQSHPRSHRVLHPLRLPPLFSTSS